MDPVYTAPQKGQDDRREHSVPGNSGVPDPMGGKATSGRIPEICQTLSWPILIDEIFCAGDITGDGSVSIADLLVVIEQWGTCAGCSADIDENNVVNVNDLLLVVEAWGPCS